MEDGHADRRSAARLIGGDFSRLSVKYARRTVNHWQSKPESRGGAVPSSARHGAIQPSGLISRNFSRAERQQSARIAQFAVLGAFEEVENNLAGLRVLETEARKQNAAVAESRRGVELFTYLYKGGANPYLDVVTVQTVELSNERNPVDILRRRFDARVLLIKALGGGWDISKLPPVSGR